MSVGVVVFINSVSSGNDNHCSSMQQAAQEKTMDAHAKNANGAKKGACTLSEHACMHPGCSSKYLLKAARKALQQASCKNPDFLVATLVMQCMKSTQLCAKH